MGAVNLLFVALTALAISMAITPGLMRLAPRLRMVDMPDARKVHAHAIPRVGGLGIIGGALTAVLFWVPAQPWLASYVFGSVVLLVFGAADDSLGLGHYAKFIGQIAAAAAVVYVGDIWVAHLPFVAGAISPDIGKPFTIFALVGLINAINHSDGLDGLAGGEVLMSLGCIGYLAHAAMYTTGLLAFVAAVAGGVFGFLRFNTHPARVFMGDAGSQFIGFSLGVLVVLLTEKANPSLSMALPALIVGLPIVDILAVFGQRVLGGMNWFRATRNHIHHRLLDVGFQHHEVVIIIYSVQALLVGSALLLAYEADATVVAAYLAVCGSLFALITTAERRGWRWRRHRVAESSAPGGRLAPRLRRLALRFVRVTVPVFLVASSIAVTKVSPDFAFTAVAVLALALASLALRTAREADWLLRLALFCGAASVVYLGPAAGDSGSVVGVVQDVYLIVLALAIAIAVRYGTGQGFSTTPLDVLLVITVLAAGALGFRDPGSSDTAALLLRLAVLFYGCELTVSGAGRPTRASEWSLVSVALVLLVKIFAIA